MKETSMKDSQRFKIGQLVFNTYGQYLCIISNGFERAGEFVPNEGKAFFTLTNDERVYTKFFSVKPDQLKIVGEVTEV